MDDKTLKYMADRVVKGSALAAKIDRSTQLHDALLTTKPGENKAKLEIGEAGRNSFTIGIGFMLGVTDIELFDLLRESLLELTAQRLAQLREEYAAL